jgi:hypothetical protein
LRLPQGIVKRQIVLMHQFKGSFNDKLSFVFGPMDACSHA